MTDLAAIVARDAAYYPYNAPDGKAVADRRALLALLRETRDALLWTLRNDGGECPADYPAVYVKAMKAALALAALDTEVPA